MTIVNLPSPNSPPLPKITKQDLKKRIEELSNAINLNKDTEKQVQHFIELIEKYNKNNPTVLKILISFSFILSPY